VKDKIMKTNQLLRIAIITLAVFGVAAASRAQTNAVFQQNANGQSLGFDSCGTEHFASNTNLWTRSEAFGSDCNMQSYLADVSNWNIPNYPNGNFNVTINPTSRPDGVHLNESVAVNNLTINTNGLLAYDANNSAGGGAHPVNLTLNGGTLANNGTIISIGPVEAGQTYTFAVNTSLTGSGTTNLGYGTTLAGPGTLTIGSSQTVIGGGNVLVNTPLVNNGLINANGSSAFFNHPEVSFMTSQITNTGTMETTGGGVIQFLTNTALNNAGGTLSSLGTTSFVLSGGVSITGGTLMSVGNRPENDFFRVLGATLTGVNIATGTQIAVGNANGNGGSVTLNGAITNGGQIIFHGNFNAVPPFNIGSDTTISGTGHLILIGLGTIASGATLTLGPGQTLDAGFTSLTGSIANNGLINASSDRGLTLTGGNSANHGTMRSVGNGLLVITSDAQGGYTLDNTGGTIQAIDSSQVVFAGQYTVRNGVLNAPGNPNNGRPNIAMNKFLTLENVTNNGLFYLAGGCESVTLSIAGGSFTNNGAFWDTAGGCDPQNIHLLGDATLNGNGYMALYRSTKIDSSNSGVLTNGESHTIGAGSGTAIQCSLVNNGDIGCNDSNGNQAFLNGPTVTNNGVLHASVGVLQQAGNSILTNYNAATQTLTGGIYETINGGTLNLNIGPIAINAATVILSGQGNFSPINSIQQNLGTLAILGGRSFSTPTTSGKSETDVLDVADLANAGTVKLDENSALNVSGNYSQGSNGRLYIEIGSNGPNPNFHPLNVSGTASLAGTLDVRLVNGFVPGSTQTFPIINAAGISGGFNQVHGADITVTANGVSIHPNGAPIPLAIKSAVSRKTHQASGTVAGTFDVDLPLTGPSGVECRSGGSGNNHKLVFTFNNDVVSGTAAVTAGTATLAGPPVFPGDPNLNFIPRNTMIVNLTGVTNGQTLAVTLSNVTDTFGQVLPSTAVNVKMLLGDVTGNGAVNSSDVSQTQFESGHAVSTMNYRADVTVNGEINSSDVSTVQGQSGTARPPQPKGASAIRDRVSVVSGRQE
jgi:fibronectin-binding autotransporter adhesin